MTWVVAAIVALVAFVLLVRLLSGGQAAPPVVAASSSSKRKLASKPPGARSESGKKSGRGKKNEAQAKTKRQESKPEQKTETRPATPPMAPGSIRPLSMPPPPNDFDQDWDDVDVTMVAELPDEIKALQKGFRSVDPKEAVAQAVQEAYDDTAEIEVVEERMVDGLLVEELLTDEDTGPNALVLPVGVVQSDVGRRRPNNEDRLLDLPEHFVFGVADGMGGHAAGEVASALVVDSLRGSLGETEDNSESMQRLIEQAVQRANADVFEAARATAREGMG
ncbi:MAG: hypothetical protein CVU63_25120, partial [Deltaproteobacteria bacterium HGW-Deltaproteobacteria-20]